MGKLRYALISMKVGEMGKVAVLIDQHEVIT